MQYLDRSLSLDPDDGETLTAPGLAHADLEEHELAVADYTRVIKLEPH